MLRQLAGFALCGFLMHSAHAQTSAKLPEMSHKGAYVSSAAFAPDGSLWLVQYDGGGQLQLKISADDGQTWQAARTLNTGNDKINIAGESNPKIVFGPNGVVLISYAQPLTKRFTGEIRLLRSTDHGKTFAPPVTVHQDRQIISHSFSTMAFDARGQLHTIWIDSRDKAKSLADNRMQHPIRQSNSCIVVLRCIIIFPAMAEPVLVLISNLPTIVVNAAD